MIIIATIPFHKSAQIIIVKFAKNLTLTDLAFANALDLRRMQRILLVIVCLSVAVQDTLSPFEQHSESADRGGALAACRVQLALDFTRDDAKDSSYWV